MRINGKSRITGKYGAFDRKMDRKKEQIQERWESGKASLYRRGRADSVTRLGSNLSVGEAFSACVSSSHLSYFIGISELKRLCFYKKSSGYFYFFPASGYRNYNDGILNASGTNGYGWTSTPYNSSNAWNLNFNSGNANMNNNNRGNGFPVRCVQASAPVFVFIKNTFVFFPAAGQRHDSNGRLDAMGTWGLVMSSTSSDSRTWTLEFHAGGASVYSDYRSRGYSVRCVQASAAVGIASIKNTEQIRFRRESGKASLCRRGQADSVTCLGRKLSVGHSFLPCAASSYLFPLIKLLVFKSLYFYKYSSGYSLFFPASGYRHYNDGKLNSSGTNGYAWSSTLSGGKAYNLTFNSGGANLHLNENRGHGFSVRCVQASAAVFAFAKDTFVFFPASGFRYLDARLYNVGTEGHGWTSTSTGSSAWHYGGSAGGGALAVHSHEFGFPVRCVQASAAVFVYVRKDIEDTFVFFPASGNRNPSSGNLGNSGLSGYGWTSVPNGGNAWYLDVFPSNARVLDNVSGGYGFPVRCVQASASVWAVQKENIKQIRYRRESGKACLCRRGQADSVTRLERKLSVGHSFLPYAALSYLFPLIELPVFKSLYFYKYSSGYFLFFPASGCRYYNDGRLVNSGSSGYGWTSTPTGSDSAADLTVRSGTVYMYYDDSRNYGFSVRCVEATATVFASGVNRNEIINVDKGIM